MNPLASNRTAPHHAARQRRQDRFDLDL